MACRIRVHMELFRGSFAKYVRESQALTLEQAVKKVTALPAARMHFNDRGQLKEGYVADITIFDLETIIDCATYIEPKQFPKGIDYVLVGGEIALEHGQVYDVKKGQVIDGQCIGRNDSMKVTIIGSGSTYTPELINGFIKRKDQLPVDAFYLMDIDVKKNAIVSGLVKRMLLEAGVTAKLVITNDLDEAIEGAAYVLTQVRIGNLDARILDESIPLKYGLLGQETTGVGGDEAMRTIPFIMKVCQKMKTLAPDAWLINFTNPSGLVTEAIVNHMDVKMVGLCNGPINMVRQIKQVVPKEVQVFDYNFVGLNHLCWIVNVYADQKDILPKLMEGGLDIPGMSNVPQASYSEDLLKATKGIPISYLNYYYYRDQQVEKCQKAEKSRGEICQGIEEDLLKLYQDETLNTCPEILNQRGGSLYSEAAVSVIDAIENDLNEIHVVDTKTKGLCLYGYR